MSLLEKAWNWNTTSAEWRDRYPCDAYVAGPQRAIMRAIDIDAPASVVYRWVCQVKVAPYSYDLLDNLGRRSPQRLTPGVERLAPGQRFLVGFTIAEFELDRHVTVSAGRGWLCGAMALTYAVVPTGPASSRLIAKFDVECRSAWDRVRLFLLAWGDLVMMRKQFLTLKALAERDACEAADGSEPLGSLAGDSARGPGGSARGVRPLVALGSRVMRPEQCACDHGDRAAGHDVTESEQ